MGGIDIRFGESARGAAPIIREGAKGMRHDLDLLDRLRPLYSGVVGDVLDRMGFRQQIMDWTIRPLWPEATVVGFAYPVQAEETDHLADEPYKLELAAVDALTEGDVMVVAGAGRRAAFWGELLSTSARQRGCRGAVVDGMARDCRSIMQMEFPLFHVGMSPADSYGRLEVTAHGEPVTCAGVRVARGDLVLGDYDGVVVVPAAIAADVLAQAAAKVRTEDEVRAALQRGVSATETFQRYGVL
jgi:regulator of RNase E activity RraA